MSSSFAFVLRDSVHVIRKEVKIDNGKTGKDKKTLKIAYPIFEGDISPDVLKKIKEKYSFEKVWEETIDQMKTDFLTGSTGDSPDIDFDVTYNKNNIFAISFSRFLSDHAYGEGHSFIINLTNGEELKINDILQEETFDNLAKMINEQMQIEIIEGEKHENFTEGTFSGIIFTKEKLKKFSK